MRTKNQNGRPVGIDATQAHEKVQRGDALLVCAYDDADKCNKLKLEGAISLVELQARLDHVSPDQEIIFYCA